MILCINMSFRSLHVVSVQMHTDMVLGLLQVDVSNGDKTHSSKQATLHTKRISRNDQVRSRVVHHGFMHAIKKYN